MVPAKCGRPSLTIVVEDRRMSETTLQEIIERKDYSRIHSSIEIPDLIEIQKRSYEEFLQREVEPERRKDHGLQAALASVFPIPDYNNTAVWAFTSYTLGSSKDEV